MDRANDGGGQAALAVGALHTVRPAAWGFGGEAVGTLEDGAPVAVAHAIPGEVVVAELVRGPRRPGGAWRARAVEVVDGREAVAQRVPPACAAYARCPGCHLRHVPRDVELALKRRAVKDAFVRWGGGAAAGSLEVEEVAAAGMGAAVRDGYRIRARATAVTEDGRPAMRPFAAGDAPVPLDACPVMHPAWAAEAGGTNAGWTLPNPGMRPVLDGVVAQLLDVQGDDSVVEVGAGRGALTVALAGGARRWVGLDVDRAALEEGRAQVAAAGLAAPDGPVTLRAGRVDKAWRRLLLAEGRFDAALVNPMRRPLGENAMAALGALGIGRLVYVGPSPRGAARDLGALARRAGLALARILPVDLYPGTYHVLVVALARRL